jgi:hypothetical protein
VTLLPIIERELRVAARKRSTFWMRVLAGLIAIVIGGGFMAISAASGVGTARMGAALFGTLTWLALAASLSAGLFFTSDALSEEKREGTLGFLFLTDLRGYDIAGGKLVATSLRGSYALLAFFPILAVTLLMGQVTGALFWKTTLALVNALFCSLSAGLLISAVSRDSQKAMAGTLLVLLLWAAGGPIADAIYGEARGGHFQPQLSLSSPAYVFTAAGGWRAPYWLGLATSHLCGWALLGLASVLAPRTWQERSRKGKSGRLNYAWKYGRARARAALRRKLVGRNPVLWLACRDRSQVRALWILFTLVGGFFAWFAFEWPSEVWAMWSEFSVLFVVLLYLWTASQASRFFVDARRNGLLELLLAVPLQESEIVQGQWRALIRIFAIPVFLLLLVNLVGSYLAQHTTWRAAGGGLGPDTILILIQAAMGALATVANLGALCWIGIWMGLRSKNGNLATLKTLLIVQVIPWMLISFASAIIVEVILFHWQQKMGGAIPQAAMNFAAVMGLVSGALTIAKDLAFLFWARHRLYSSFREQAVNSVSPIRVMPSPPPALPPPLPPPRIAAGAV